ncbi:hypothetical protein Goshw_029528 [Gossypium schwendimanii]|uniref:Uncharacterized protein n=1 Tax=Gossypium schwendimanii TaxID=34291 RepID=A0A7J9M8F4_GOSSC|nr:hypothetical protein [Gossypium schwendimanii]
MDCGPNLCFCVCIAGEKQHKACGVIAQESLYGTNLAYVITSASSIK